jgi:CheY-like chemotaxis protein
MKTTDVCVVSCVSDKCDKCYVDFFTGRKDFAKEWIQSKTLVESNSTQVTPKITPKISHKTYKEYPIEMGPTTTFIIINSLEPEHKSLKGTLTFLRFVLMSHNETSLSSKDLFLANISHEIRTPLNGIVGYSQLLMQTELDSTQKNYVTSMNQCSIQLMQIINDVLDFSKLASGKMELREECCSVKEIVSLAVDAIHNRIREKKQVLTHTITPLTPSYIIADKQKISQIIVNLLSNATKFTGIKGTIGLHIDTNPNDNILKISVQDAGCGISAEDQKRLFRPFFQANNTVTKQAGGTGLGLSICKKLSELMNGVFEVKSTVGSGSCFTFHLRYKPYTEKDILLDSNLDGKYVLVVDDNSSNRIILSEMLFEWNIKPIVCGTAFEAYRMIVGKRYDFECCLIDICMPITSGIELAKQLKEECPRLPLIALSSIDDHTSTCDSLYFECKLSKPINKTQLFSSIQKVINHSDVSPSVFVRKSHTTIVSNSYIGSEKNNPSILIAEDTSISRQMLLNMVETLGYKNVKAVKDGVEAIRKLSTHTYDIILLDLKMPEKSGFDVLEYIRSSREKQSRKTPIVIAITASILDEDKQKCVDLGVDYYIYKPIDMKQIKNILQHASSI